MAPTSGSGGLPPKQKNFSKTSLDSQDECIQTMGEDCGLGKILLGIRYQASKSCLEVRIVKAEGLRGSRTVEAADAPKPSTHCTVAFLPDRTEPVSTTTVDSSDCPRWRAAFRFERFPWVASSSNQRCLQVQVINTATGAAMSEATLLLGNWSQEEYATGVRAWKYLNGTMETQRVSGKEGNAFMTLYFGSDRLKLTLHRIEDLNPRWTTASESPEFQVKLQAVLSGRVIKESTLRGLRCSVGGEVNFYDGRFNIRLGGKSGHSPRCLTLRLVMTRQFDCISQELYWLDLGAEVRRQECCNLFQSVLENANQSHVVSVLLNKPPVAPL